eukprot:254828-Chlamydomonas_euryale.AAC.1
MSAISTLVSSNSCAFVDVVADAAGVPDADDAPGAAPSELCCCRCGCCGSGAAVAAGAAAPGSEPWLLPTYSFNLRLISWSARPGEASRDGGREPPRLSPAPPGNLDQRSGGSDGPQLVRGDAARGRPAPLPGRLPSMPPRGARSRGTRSRDEGRDPGAAAAARDDPYSGYAAAAAGGSDPRAGTP